MESSCRYCTDNHKPECCEACLVDMLREQGEENERLTTRITELEQINRQNEFALKQYRGD